MLRAVKFRGAPHIAQNAKFSSHVTFPACGSFRSILYQTTAAEASVSEPETYQCQAPHRNFCPTKNCPWMKFSEIFVLWDKTCVLGQKMLQI